MTTHADNDKMRKSFKLTDILWVLFFAGMGLLLIYAVMSLVYGWEMSMLKKQLMGN